MSDESRLIQLEVLTAHQERTIAELSDELARQWQTIERMQKKLDVLTTRFLALEEQSQPDTPVTKPPHY